MNLPKGILVLSKRDGSKLNFEELDIARESIASLIEDGAFERDPYILTTGIQVQYVPLDAEFDPHTQIVTGTLNVRNTLTMKETEITLGEPL